MKGRLRREATDVLVIWDDAAIAIEYKSQALNANGTPRLEEAEPDCPNLRDATLQVAGAAKNLKSGGSSLRNERRGDLKRNSEQRRSVVMTRVLAAARRSTNHALVAEPARLYRSAHARILFCVAGCGRRRLAHRLDCRGSICQRRRQMRAK